MAGIPAAPTVYQTANLSLPSGTQVGVWQGAVDCVNRKVVNFATSATPYAARSTAKIPIDSGIVGAWMDTGTTRIEFTLYVNNTNPFVDYMNLTRAGVATFIREFRFMINGTPVEQLRNYNRIVENAYVIRNQNAEPYYHFVPNPWEPPCAKYLPEEANFIRPSMVDMMGRPMFAYQFISDSNPYDFMFLSGISQDGCGKWNGGDTTAYPGFQSYQEQETTIVNASGLAEKLVANYQKIVNGIDTTQCPALNVDLYNFPNGPTLYTSTDQLQQVFRSSSSYQPNVNGPNSLISTDGTGAVQLRYTFSGWGRFPPCASAFLLAAPGYSGDIHMRGVYAKMEGQELGNVLSPPTLTSTNNLYNGLNENKNNHWSSCLFGGPMSEWGWVGETQAYFGGHRTHYSPACWPYGQPMLKPAKQNNARYRPQDLMQDLSNSRNIPIGYGRNYQLNQAGMDNFLFNVDQVSSISDNIHEFQVSMRLYSGWLGTETKTYFPHGLIPPGKMWIELDLEEPRIAFWTTMDPCRRVPGTIRDFVPYTGRPNGLSRFANDNLNPIMGPICAYLPVFTNDYWENNATTPNSATSISWFGGTVESSTPYALGLRGYPGYVYGLFGICYNTNACLGLVGQPRASGLGTYCNGATTYEDGKQDETAAQGWYNINAGNYMTDTLGPITAAFDGLPNSVANNPISITSGMPVPQFVPVAQPWAMKGIFSDSGIDITPLIYVNEAYSCFGTYLRQSVAQTKRTWAASLTGFTSLTTTSQDQSQVSMASQYANYYTGAYTGAGLSYEIKNLQFSFQELLLPDDTSAAIISAASRGFFEYSGNIWQCVYNNASNAYQQNLLLPVVGSMVNSIFMNFQSNVAVATDDAYMYPSLSSYNPFTSCQFAPATFNNQSLYHVGGNYVFNNMLTSQNALGINLQYKIGATYYPQQPINNLSTLLEENEKGLETINDAKRMADMLGTYFPFRTQNTQANSSTIADEINFLEDCSFFSCFIPVEALDDQTIIGNPFLNAIERSETVTSLPYPLRGLRAPSLSSANMWTTYPTSSGTNLIPQNTSYQSGVLNLFNVLQGHFFLALSLTRFRGMIGKAELGTAIIGNQFFLITQMAPFFNHYVNQRQNSVLVYAIYYCTARIRFQGGGDVQTLY